MKEWYEAYYGKAYAASVASLLDEDRTRREVRYIIRETRLEPPARIADVGCGNGRHAAVFAKEGFQVMGVDLNPEFIHQAKQSTVGLPISFTVGDMRQAIGGPYELVVSLFNSFGFFSDAENQQVLEDWLSRLSPRGWFVIDLWNRDAMIRHFQPSRNRTLSGLQVKETAHFDSRSERVFKEYEYVFPDGEVERLQAVFRVYTVHEICSLLEARDMKIEAVHGNMAGEPYDYDSERLVVLARAST